MAEEFKKKFGFEKPSTMYGGENAAFEAVPNLDPTRDKLFSYLEEYLPNQAGNIVGGEGRGFMNMGYIDIPVIGDAMDIYDASGRLIDAYKTDSYTARDDAMIGRLPFAAQVAMMLTTDKDGSSPVSGDYYRNKAEPMTYLTTIAGAGGALAGLGVKAAKFLSVLKNKVDRVFPDPSNMDLQMDAAADSLTARRPTGSQTDLSGALGQFSNKPIPKQNMPLSQQELDELLYGDFTPPMTASERARLMEMQNPADVFDDAGVMSLEELKRNPEISRPQRMSVFYNE